MTPRKEMTSSVVLILFSMIFLIYTTRYPIDDWESPGPAVFPLIVGGVLLILASWQLFRALLQRRSPDRNEEAVATIASLRNTLQQNKGETKVLVLTAMLIAYILLMKWIGFFVCTFLLVIFSSRLMEAKDWSRPIALSAGVSIFCYFLFEVWLKLSFPRGILF